MGWSGLPVCASGGVSLSDGYDSLGGGAWLAMKAVEVQGLLWILSLTHSGSGLAREWGRWAAVRWLLSMFGVGPRWQCVAGEDGGWGFGCWVLEVCV